MSMSDQSMTRRSAVKLGGATLAAVSLPTGASPAHLSSAPTPPASYPDFRGKTVLFYTSNKESGYEILTDPVFTMLNGRLFLTGTIPALGFWTDNLPAAFAWDLVRSYLVFDSVEDYAARKDAHKKWNEAKTHATALADQPLE
jgi:hypothetical protein